MNQRSLNQLVEENRGLFWYIPENKLHYLSKETIVEGLLNLGTVDTVKRLIQILGIKQVAKIFKEKTKGPRINYYPQVVNYFNLYFNRHA